MQVSIETTSGLERRLTVGVPAAEVDSEVQKRLQQAAQNIRINGFRKGKVPMKVVRQRYGAGVRQEVLGELINRSFYEAVSKEQVKPAGQPSIEPKQFEEGKDLEYVATFEVYPSVELGDFSGFEITRYKADVSAEDVDKMIDVLREHQAGWKEVDRAAQDGDQVNIDFVGTRDGVEFEGGSAKGQNLVLGSGSMIPGFEAGIEGLKAGEEKTLELTFPEDYQAEDLRGAKVEFKVTVNAVSEKELPELDKEFYAKFGVEKGGKPQFRKEVKANMTRELKNAVRNKVKTQVMDALLESHKPDLPKALVDSEIETLRQQMLQRFGGQQQNFDVKSLLPDNMFEEEAQRRVALGLVVGEIVKQHDIKVDSDRVRELVEEMASTYEEPEAVVNYYYENRQLLASVESAALEDQVVDFVLDKAKVTDESASYDDVVGSQKQS
ncbi:trigger factor [Marinimicrobium sp. ARAG 43.8]|uniref:trigger factor n=1 Tax=Marinimicrobium sp. ARAG 43.8 TaxID=3418719 RepID=UPI003CF56616